jgi:hypothetical protein
MPLTRPLATFWKVIATYNIEGVAALLRIEKLNLQQRGLFHAPTQTVNQFLKRSRSRTLVFGIPGPGHLHTGGVFIEPRASSVHAVARKRLEVSSCVLRSISGVSCENRLLCTVGGVMAAARNRLVGASKGRQES